MNMILGQSANNIIITIKVIIYFIFVIILAYFAGIETALLRYSAKRKFINDKIKGYIEIWEKNPALILATILVGTNFACAGVGVLSNSLNINIIISTLVLLIFGEILPKMISFSNSDKILNFGIKRLVLFSKTIIPLTNFLVSFSSFILSFFIGEKSKEDPFLSSEELKELIKQDENVSQEEQKMFANVIELADKRIYEIMVPKEDIVAINSNASIEEIIEKLSNTKFSRVPVFRGSIDNIIGIVYTKDITVAMQNKSLLLLDDIIRPPYFVINTAKVVDILKQFKQGKNHLAVVVDEYGATMGIVTIEDIIEEIFGEIYDEYDVKEEKIIRLNVQDYIVMGDESLKKINDFFGSRFNDDEVVTLSGYIITKLGRMPVVGEKIILENLEIEILDTTNKVIKRVKTTKK